MNRPRLLDLFCGAGGCSMGYFRAGFDVVGVDNRPQPRYPFTFVQADAFDFLRWLIHDTSRFRPEWTGYRLSQFTTIHASPPCQAYSCTRHLPNARSHHPDLLGTMREVLKQSGKPWIIENVMGAPMQPPAIMLCGLMFGLGVFRHRWFESSTLLLAPSHPAHGRRRIGEGGMCCVAGNGSGSSGYRRKDGSGRRVVPYDHRSAAAWSKAMGIDWMTRNELSQAIPPAYTLFLGRQLLDRL